MTGKVELLARIKESAGGWVDGWVMVEGKSLVHRMINEEKRPRRREEPAWQNNVFV